MGARLQRLAERPANPDVVRPDLFRAPDRNVELQMDVFGLQLEQGGIDIVRHAATATEIEVNSVLGRCGGDVQLTGAESSGPRHSLVEERASEPRLAV